MPQLYPQDWAPQIIWLAITFGILYLLMLRVALPRIGSVIDARHAFIVGELQRAEALRKEAQEAIAAYEQTLAEAKQKAQAIAQGAREKVNADIAAERASLEQELAAKSAEADRRIDAAKSSALTEVNRIAEDVATEIVRRLIGIEPAKAEIAEAVETARKG